MESWGFKYATIAFIWHKQRTNPGHYTMSECEICLVGKRGTIPTPRGARNVRQFLSKMRGKHSAKPNEIRARIEAMFPTQNKVELFARQNVLGWDAWGNECENSITLGGEGKKN
jgi:N6-adenosine-specific RNA methylase IME4